MDFEEQIDKSKVYQQQGSGYDIKTYKREARILRGKGFLQNFAQRYAYPVFQSFMRFAQPIAKDLFTDVKTAATDSLKKSASKKFEDMVSKIGQKGKARKRKRRRRSKKGKTAKKKRTNRRSRQKGGKGVKPKRVRRQRGKSIKRKTKRKSVNKSIVPGFSNDIFK